jgi:glyoxylase-like metal-dependent hydrolase (beta-lactamase superfamily II)
MRRITLLGALVAAGVLSVAVGAQQPAAPSAAAVGVQKVRDNLYVMTGGGGNSAVFVGTDGVTVVDTKNPGWGQPLIEKIKTVTDKPVVRIINTHTHGDHVSGNVEFPATVDIVTHENTKMTMETRKPVYGLQTETPENIFTQNNGRGLPKRTFKDKMTIGRGADQIDLYYFGRAHTDGDAWVVFPSLRVMHAGDAFHTKDLPIMDRNNGGSGVEYPRTLMAAFNNVKGIDTIINGHNPTTTTPADLRTQAEFIGEFVKFVQDAKRAGKTVDQVVSEWKTPAKYTGYADPQPNRVRADAQVVWDETR